MAIAALKQSNKAAPTEHDRDVKRKRKQVSEAARIEIPSIVDINRRERCLKDPELFLKTYFPRKYRRPFGKHHYAMIDAIVSRARHGGRQAIAAPRGCGKSELVKGLLAYLVFAEIVRFPLPIASTGELAKSIYHDFRKKLATNDMLLADFPEVCFPIRALQGAPQRASKQHVGGVLTQIVWKSDSYISLPHVIGSPFGGVKMSFYGLDAAFRGVNLDGDRPDFILIDDPETRESAKSHMQIEDREKIIDQDIAGLAEEDAELAIAVLTTIQNCICLSHKLTNRDPEKGKPAFNGMRFGMILKWPDTVTDHSDITKLGRWSEYITKRKKGQSAGDEHGKIAVQFYLDNREEMDRGHEMLTEHFTPLVLDDGTQLTFSALQVAFNKIADTNIAAYRSEYQNNPLEVAELFPMRIKSSTVIGCEREFDHRTVADNTNMIVGAVDVRKTELHYAIISSSEGEPYRVPDYDWTIHGSETTSFEEAQELVVTALEDLEDRFIDAKPLFNSKSEPFTPDLMLVDKGWMASWKEDGQRKTWTDQPVSQFCETRTQWLPCKGQPNYRSPAPKTNVVIGNNWHINQKWLNGREELEVIWNAEHYHSLVEDFFVNGSFALFKGTEGRFRGHQRLDTHIREGAADLAEMRKRSSSSRKPRHRKDHWWDSLAMALVARSVEKHFREQEANRKPAKSLKQMAMEAKR